MISCCHPSCGGHPLHLFVNTIILYTPYLYLLLKVIHIYIEFLAPEALKTANGVGFAVY